MGWSSDDIVIAVARDIRAITSAVEERITAQQLGEAFKENDDDEREQADGK